MAEKHHVVVDGSNLATEGRTAPSLRQLDEAVRAYAHDDPDAEIVVVVDASFGHRIDPEERGRFEEAELHGELVSPPAGAIGRGDAFVLRIAERTGATVLSNDSFQEFHAEHPWLFDDGRLIGGKPVPGVGWIFTPRVPVRGPKSRQVTGKAKREADRGADLPAALKAAELSRAAKKVAARRAAAPDGKAPKVGDVRGAKTAKKAKKVAAAKAVEPEKKGTAEKGPGRKAPAKGVAKAEKVAGSTKRAAKSSKQPAAAKEAKEAKPAKKAKPAEQSKRAKAATPPKAGTPAKAEAKGSRSARATKTLTTVESAPPDAEPAKKTRRSRGAKKAAVSVDGVVARPLPDLDPRVLEAIHDATAEALSPRSSAPKDKATTGGKGAKDGKAGSKGPKRRRTASPLPAVNEPLPFINFVAAYPLGSEVEGEVASFTSHGAMVDIAVPGGGSLHCYIPLTGLGDPPPNKARQVLSRGQRRTFVLVGLDPPRRVAELALPGVVPAQLAGTPSGA